jgi:hypothetical protein
MWKNHREKVYLYDVDTDMCVYIECVRVCVCVCVRVCVCVWEREYFKSKRGRETV